MLHKNNPSSDVASGSQPVKEELAIPSCLLCPVTQEILRHPVTLIPSGIVIEQQAADKIISGNRMCPISRKEITAYYSAYKVEEMIDEFLKKYPQAKEMQYVPQEPFEKKLERQVSVAEPLLSVPERKNNSSSFLDFKRDAARSASINQDFFAVFGLPPTEEFKEQKHRMNESQPHPSVRVYPPIQREIVPDPAPTPPPPLLPPPPPEMKPLEDLKKENVRKDLIADLNNLIWALKFESGPRPREIIQNDSLLFFALFIRPSPLPWQKIHVAEGPKNTGMHNVLKAAINALKQLDAKILEDAKRQFDQQYCQVKTAFGGVRSLNHSNYASFAKIMGTISDQPGHLVYKVLNKVESQLPALCQPGSALRPS